MCIRDRPEDREHAEEVLQITLLRDVHDESAPVGHTPEARRREKLKKRIADSTGAGAAASEPGAGMHRGTRRGLGDSTGRTHQRQEARQPEPPPLLQNQGRHTRETKQKPNGKQAKTQTLNAKLETPQCKFQWQQTLNFKP